MRRTKYFAELYFPSGKTRKIKSREDKGEAYEKGIKAFKQYPNALGFTLYKKEIEETILVEIKNK